MANKTIEKNEGAISKRQTKDGRRRIRLNRRERRTLEEQHLIQDAVVLFLDLETPRSNREIAAELGISITQLKNLTKTEEFVDTWNAMYMDLNESPSFKAAKSALADALPSAINTVIGIAKGTIHATGNIRLKAAEKILLLNGITRPEEPMDDRAELAKFLAEKGAVVNKGTVNVYNIPPEYLQANLAYQKEVVGEVIDGEFIETQRSLVPSSSDT